MSETPTKSLKMGPNAPFAPEKPTLRASLTAARERIVTLEARISDLQQHRAELKIEKEKAQEMAKAQRNKKKATRAALVRMAQIVLKVAEFGSSEELAASAVVHLHCN